MWNGRHSLIICNTATIHRNAQIWPAEFTLLPVVEITGGLDRHERFLLGLIWRIIPNPENILERIADKADFIRLIHTLRIQKWVDQNSLPGP